ncbi:TnpA, transposase [Photorhabdus temperata subsp. temperata M1021]|nr:TnpA, transposase [Photorhabdus temperata subsp. temperata M1021]
MKSNFEPIGGWAKIADRSTHPGPELGELCNRTAEAMAYRASGLNLVVNVIVLWNEIDRPLERYRPVRTKRFNPKNFTFR